MSESPDSQYFRDGVAEHCGDAVAPLWCEEWSCRDIKTLLGALDQLRQELTATQNMAHDLTEGLFQEGVKIERLQAAAQRILDALDDGVPSQEEIEAFRAALAPQKEC